MKVRTADCAGARSATVAALASAAGGMRIVGVARCRPLPRTQELISEPASHEPQSAQRPV